MNAPYLWVDALGRGFNAFLKTAGDDEDASLLPLLVSIARVPELPSRRRFDLCQL